MANYKKLSTIIHNLNYDSLNSEYFTQNNYLKKTNDTNLQFYKVNKDLSLYKLNLQNISFNNISEFDFSQKNPNETKITLNISKKNLLVITTNYEELNFLRNIYSASRCIGFSDETKVQNNKKYGFYFQSKGTYFITLSKEKCKDNLLIINVL